ncbi:phosphatase PAP2 family protein [Salirhabdus salicampi]|uniref:phosphatase PAP2 family protein n=1 Tax=Salirhabdus salicampi TaxID=476102 RepID=UPI0020C25A06|nr:phosphatase PAP2 family protein [Salirhabdus salicampi]MCP8617971.1 phosphatase PAP2 family protein [Salirhabdus salicampi]
MNDYLFHLIHQLAGQSIWLDQIMILFSKWGFIAMIIFTIGLTVTRKWRKVGVIGIVALGVSLVVNRVLKIVFNQPRPFMEHDIEILIARSPSPSFPSDQAVICGVIVALCFMLGRKTGTIAFVIGSLIAISRVFVGHHYPFDIVVGFILGSFFTLVIRQGMEHKMDKTMNF